jgi:DNA invertase Pin-like site-specific DNA recombinase
MVNTLVVRKTQLPTFQKTFRAAQYVRMSTDYQRYSIENQAAVIAAYAQLHDLSIVHTYRDEGESGLKLKNRVGLAQLLNDVSSGQTDFEHILVYDVSRWGRFQDVDESAHYEFICKQAGIMVSYCAEQFENDGSMVSSIVKNIKRVMAAEYSRELSVKVHAGACRFARQGFQIGGPVAYALQRLLVDEKLQPKGVLAKGDRKYIQTDHVRLQPGAANEVAVVQWIFHRFLEVRSEKAVARELNRKGTPTRTGERWRGSYIGRILKNENYVGNLLYNRRSKKLGGPPVYNPPNVWIRSERCIEPIVGLGVFLAAKKIIEERRVDLSEEEMLARLRRTLMKEGRLSPAIINKTVGLPCHQVYINHFGSLRNAYRLIGYTSKRNCDYIDSRQVWADLVGKFASEMGAAIGNVGGCDDPLSCLRVNGLSISFRIARWCPGKKKIHSPYWAIRRQAYLPAGWVVAIRLAEGNQAVLDFLLLPTTEMTGSVVKLSESTRVRRGVRRFDKFDALVRSVSHVTKPNRTRVSPTKPARPDKGSRASCSKIMSGRARR